MPYPPWTPTAPQRLHNISVQKKRQPRAWFLGAPGVHSLSRVTVRLPVPQPFNSTREERPNKPQRGTSFVKGRVLHWRCVVEDVLPAPIRHGLRFGEESGDVSGGAVPPSTSSGFSLQQETAWFRAQNTMTVLQK